MFIAAEIQSSNRRNVISHTGTPNWSKYSCVSVYMPAYNIEI